MSASKIASRTGLAPPGVRLARWAGLSTAGILLGVIGSRLFGGTVAGLFDLYYLCLLGVYALLLAFPYGRLRVPGQWRAGFIFLVVVSVVFVFSTIVAVMFDYLEASARGERLGLPGFEGTLIFLGLLQVPAVLFERHPEYLDDEPDEHGPSGSGSRPGA